MLEQSTEASAAQLAEGPELEMELVPAAAVGEEEEEGEEAAVAEEAGVAATGA